MYLVIDADGTPKYTDDAATAERFIACEDFTVIHIDMGQGGMAWLYDAGEGQKTLSIEQIQ